MPGFRAVQPSDSSMSREHIYNVCNTSEVFAVMQQGTVKLLVAILQNNNFRTENCESASSLKDHNV